MKAQNGTACHIYSASSGSPRGTGGLSRAQRQSIENAIWCCASDGRLIDTNKGGRYPAELLKHWKLLHEARVDRERAGFETHLGWVHRLEIINSVLFRPSAELKFSKATLIYGDGPVGKSSICADNQPDSGKPRESEGLCVCPPSGSAALHFDDCVIFTYAGLVNEQVRLGLSAPPKIWVCPLVNFAVEPVRAIGPS
jgi:hypothetical protein